MSTWFTSKPSRFWQCANSLNKTNNNKEANVNFTDQKSRVYECKVTLSTAIALKKMGIDLMGAFDGKLWEQLAADPALLLDVLAVSVKSSLESMNITEAEFAESLGGDSLESATKALMDAIADFSPPLQRAAMRKLIQKTAAVEKLAGEEINRKLDQVTPQMIFDSMNGSTNKLESSTSLPVSSATSAPVNSSGSSVDTVAINGTEQGSY